MKVLISRTANASSDSGSFLLLFLGGGGNYQSSILMSLSFAVIKLIT